MDKTETKIVYKYSVSGVFMGLLTLDYTDRSPISGRWLIPSHCTIIAPPEEKQGFDRVFAEGVWTYKKQETKKPEETEGEPESPAEELTLQEKQEELTKAYEKDKAIYLQQLLDALAHNDSEVLEEVKEDLATLDATYAQEYKTLSSLENEDSSEVGAEVSQESSAVPKEVLEDAHVMEGK